MGLIVPSGKLVTNPRDIRRGLAMMRRRSRPNRAAGDDVLLKFADATYTNANGYRYAWNPRNNTLYGPFGANVRPQFAYAGRNYIPSFEAVTETTGYTETIHGNWTALGGASTTADQIAAPDSAKLADKLTFGAAAGDGIKIALGSATNDTDQTIAVWVKTASGTKDFRLGFLKKDNTATYSADKTATTTWQRFDHTVDIDAGATAPEARIVNDSGGAAGDIYIWGAAVYKDKSFPWAYRTNDTGADQAQAKDQLYWAAEAVSVAAREDININGCPAYANGESLNHAFCMYDDATQDYRLVLSPVNSELRFFEGNIEKLGADATWSRNQLLTVGLRPADGDVYASGFTTGNGTHATSLASWTTDSDELYWGERSNGTILFNGLLSEPYKP